MPPTLGAALLCSSRAGSDMWLLFGNSILLPRRNHQYGISLETQFSRDLETARFEPGAAGSQSTAEPQSYQASVIAVSCFEKCLNFFSMVTLFKKLLTLLKWLTAVKFICTI